MKKVRICVLLFIILSGIFVTNYGGPIPYLLFECAVFIPLLCFVYTVYVYARFRIYQEVNHKTLLKEEPADYLIQVGNEDFITYEHIKLNFFDDNSTVVQTETLQECFLLPGEKKVYKTIILCKYRGNYPIGIKSVKVTDFLHLFSITYPIKESYKVTVLPKTVMLDSCFFLEENLDKKTASNSYSIEEQELDAEMRPYTYGDEKKMIHWKQMAKTEELYVRKRVNGAKKQVAIYLELLQTDEDVKVAVEDRMLEAALAIAYYCVEHTTSCQLVYEQGSVISQEVNSLISYDSFYHDTAKLVFRGKMTAGELYESKSPSEDAIVVFLVMELGDKQVTEINLVCSHNHSVTVIVMGEEPDNFDRTILDAIILFMPYTANVKKLLEEGESM